MAYWRKKKKKEVKNVDIFGNIYMYLWRKQYWQVHIHIVTAVRMPVNIFAYTDDFS